MEPEKKIAKQVDIIPIQGLQVVSVKEALAEAREHPMTYEEIKEWCKSVGAQEPPPPPSMER